MPQKDPPAVTTPKPTLSINDGDLSTSIDDTPSTHNTAVTLSFKRVSDMLQTYPAIWSALIHLTLFTVCALWGAWAVVGKYTVTYIEPLIFLTIRLCLSALLYLVILMLHKRSLPPLLAWQHVWRIAVLALCGLLFGQLMFMNGLRRTTASNTAILQMLTPPITSFFSLLLGTERLMWQKIVGMSCAVMGAVAFLGIDNFQLANDTMVGNLLVCVSCCTSTFYLLWGKPLFQHVGSLVVTTYCFGFAALGSLAISLAFYLDQWRVVLSTPIPTMAWWGVVYCIAIATVFGYLYVYLTDTHTHTYTHTRDRDRATDYQHQSVLVRY
jgi:drug/metabolite transporter (DMT)-like permease